MSYKGVLMISEFPEGRTFGVTSTIEEAVSVFQRLRESLTDGYAYNPRYYNIPIGATFMLDGRIMLVNPNPIDDGHMLHMFGAMDQEVVPTTYLIPHRGTCCTEGPKLNSTDAKRITDLPSPKIFYYPQYYDMDGTKHEYTDYPDHVHEELSAYFVIE